MDQKRWNILLRIIALVLAVVLAASGVYVGRSAIAYESALNLMKEQRYEQAAAAFAALGQYQDAASYAMYCRAVTAGESGQYTEAARNLANMGGFGDSELQSVYYAAWARCAAEDYDGAAELFATISLYRDAAARSAEMLGRHAAQQDALEAAARAEREAAAAASKAAAEKAEQDRVAKAQAAQASAYEAACKAEAAGDVIAAFEGFQSLVDYLDCAERMEALRLPYQYARAMKDVESGRYAKALAAFRALGDYSDSAEKARILTASEYADLYAISDTLISFRLNGLWGLINMEENIASAPQWSAMAAWDHGLIRVMANDRFGFINDRGEVVIACDMIEADRFNADGLCRVSKESGWGYIDQTGKEIIPCTYTAISEMKDGLCTVLSSRALGIVDKTGSVVLEDSWSRLGSSSADWYGYSLQAPSYDAYGLMICCDQRGSYGLVNKAGKLVGDVRWDEISAFSEGLARVKSGRKYGFIRTDGSVLVEPAYAEASAFANGMARVRQGNLYGYINAQGELAIPAIYHEANDFADGMAVVKLSSIGYLLIDKTGADKHFDVIPYQRAKQLLAAGDYQGAGEAFAALGSYGDSPAMVLESKYQYALSAMQQGDANAAYMLYTGDLAGYKDSAALAQQIRADRMYDSGRYAAAWTLYAELDEAYHTHDADYQAMYTAAEAKLTAGSWDEAISAFESLGAYSDSASRIQQGYEGKYAAEYTAATKLLDDGKYDEAEALFTSLGVYSKAQDMVLECRYRKAGSLAGSGNRAGAAALYKALGEYRNSALLLLQLNADELFDKGDLSGAYDIYAALDAAYHTHTADYEVKYASAAALRDAGNLSAAADAFELLGAYSDSAAQATETRYLLAGKLAAHGSYAEARAIYTALGKHKDSASLAKRCTADSLYAAGDYSAAYDVYVTLDEAYHTHAADYAAMYASAEALRTQGKFDDAQQAFAALGAYDDSAAQITETRYQHAVALANEGSSTAAAKLFSALGSYKDSAAMVTRCQADALFAAGKHADAWAIYATLAEAYHTHAADYTALYAAAEELEIQHDYSGAATAFTALGAYSDSAERANAAHYAFGRQLMDSGSFEAARDVFSDISAYRDSAVLAQQCVADALYASGKYGAAWDIYTELNLTTLRAVDYASLYAAAEKLRSDGNYDSAINAFTALGSYSDSAAQITETRYQQGLNKIAIKAYTSAATIFKGLGDYKDSQTQLTRIRADELFAKGSYAEAWEIYASLDASYNTHLDGYAALYANAEKLRLAGQFDEAYDVYASLGSYGDAADQLLLVSVNKAESLFSKGDYLSAAELYATLGDSLNNRNARYQHALACKADGSYTEASSVWLALAAEEASDKYGDGREQNYRMGLETMQAHPADALAVLCADIDYKDAREQVYQLALTQDQLKNYAVAVAAYQFLGAYKDSGMNLTIATYAYGEQLYAAAKYDEAAEVFAGMNGFSNTAERVKESKYAAATVALESQQFDEAISRFTALGSYSNSADMVKESKYRRGLKAYGESRFEDALEEFTALGSYSQSQLQVKKCRYAIGNREYKAGNFDKAIFQFEILKDMNYENSASSWKMARYAKYNQQDQRGKYDAAIAGFEDLGNYSDSAARALSCHYKKAQQLSGSGKIREAYDEFVLAKTHADAPQQVKIHAHLIGEELYLLAQYTEAVDWYEIAADYSTAKAQLYKIGEYYFSTQDYVAATNALKTMAGYEQASDYLYRMGEYFDRKPDLVHAYIAYGYAGDYRDALAIFSERAKQLQTEVLSVYRHMDWAKTADYCTALGTFDEDYREMANYASSGALFDRISTLKLGQYTNRPITWQYLQQDGENLIFVAQKRLADKTYSEAKSLISTLQNGLNDETRKHATIWMMSRDEVEKYLPTKELRNDGDTSTSYIWTSTLSSGYSSYYYAYYTSSLYFNDMYSSIDLGVRPGLKLNSKEALGTLLSTANSGVTAYDANGNLLSYREPPFAEGTFVPGASTVFDISNYTVSTVGSYGFNLQSNGYYVSTNKGKSNTAAVAKVTFTTTTGYIYIDVINYVESYDDYGMISKLDTPLSTNNKEDSSSSLYQSFSSSSYHKSSVQTFKIPVSDFKEHTIYLKYKKDGYTDRNNDTLQFRIRFE